MSSPLHATAPSARVSDRYRFISTADVISRLESHGWELKSELFAETCGLLTRRYARYDGDLCSHVYAVVQTFQGQDRVEISFVDGF